MVHDLTAVLERTNVNTEPFGINSKIINKHMPAPSIGLLFEASRGFLHGSSRGNLQLTCLPKDPTRDLCAWCRTLAAHWFWCLIRGGVTCQAKEVIWFEIWDVYFIYIDIDEAATKTTVVLSVSRYLFSYIHMIIQYYPYQLHLNLFLW